MMDLFASSTPNGIQMRQEWTSRIKQRNAVHRELERCQTGNSL